jgi:hypothetical protein
MREAAGARSAFATETIPVYSAAPFGPPGMGPAPPDGAHRHSSSRRVESIAASRERITQHMKHSTEPDPNHRQVDSPQTGEVGDEGRVQAEPVSRWQRVVRWIGLIVLVVASIHGVREFLAGDAAALSAMWQRTAAILPVVFLFAVLDIAVEATAWMLVFRRFGLRALDPIGAAIALSGKAGLLMPAQLGRLIRPDLMERMGRSKLSESVKAEAAVFLLDSASVAALLAALLSWRFIHPLMAPVSYVLVVGVCLVMARLITRLLAGTALGVRLGFWWSVPTFLIVVLQSSGWVAHGLGFFVLASALDGGFGLWDSLVMAPGAAVLGLASGVPGGLGATELLLGGSLGLGGVPQAQLGVGVGLFRVLTFWVWLPIGWIALGIVAFAARRRKARLAARDGCDAEPAPGESGSNPTDAVPAPTTRGMP